LRIAPSFLALFAIVGLCLYGLPFFYDFFVRDLGWSRAQVTSGNALGKLVVGPLFGFVAGWLIDRLGPRPLMIAGILLAGVALVGLGHVTALPFFLFFYLLNSLAYVLAGPLPNQVLLSRNFQHGRGRAMGIAYLGIGIGGFAAQHVSNALISAFGWRQALQALGLVVVVVALPLVLGLRRLGAVPVRAVALPRPPLRAALTSRSFYLLAIGSMASIGAVGGAFQNLKLLLSIDQQRSQDQAKWILSLILLVSLVGRVIAGELADRWGPKRVMLLVYLLVTSAMAMLALGPTGDGIYLFVVVFGLGLGGEYMIIPLVAGELFGAAVLGSRPSRPAAARDLPSPQRLGPCARGWLYAIWRVVHVGRLSPEGSGALRATPGRARPLPQLLFPHRSGASRGRARWLRQGRSRQSRSRSCRACASTP
jgi:MFS family permease